jgi:tetratricopeptide (TPR) repeat protein
MAEPGTDPAPAPLLPGPGIGGAVGWCLLLVLCAGLLAFPCAFVLSLLTAMSMTVLIFLSFPMATFVFVVFFMMKRLGDDTFHILAVRKIRLLHLLLVVLLAPPLLVLASEAGNCAARAFEERPQPGQEEPDREEPDQEDEEAHLPARQGRLPLADVSQFTWPTRLYREAAQGPWSLLLLAGCLLPALGEEAFCRGFLGRGLLARHGLLLGIGITSLLFGLLHVHPVQVCATLVLGIGLHIVYLTTRSFWGPVLLHALHNALVFTSLKLFLGTGFALTGPYDAPHLPWWYVLAAAVAVVPLFVLLYRTRVRWLLPDQKEWSPGYVTAEAPPAEAKAVPYADRPEPLPVLGAVAGCLLFAAVAIPQAIPDRAHSVAALMKQGDEHLEREEYDEAIAAYTQVIRLDPKHAPAYAGRGEALVEKEEYEEAIPDLDRAIELDPELADAYFYRGLARQRLDLPVQAIADYDEALRLDPDNAQAYANRGLAYLDKDQPERAIADLTEALQRDSEEADTFVWRGRAYLATRRHEQAIRDFTEAIRLEPKNAEAYFLRGQAFAATGEKARAAADRKEALRLDPNVGDD